MTKETVGACLEQLLAASAMTTSDNVAYELPTLLNVSDVSDI